MQDLNQEENAVELWDRQPKEPKVWFLRFQRYYLYRGLGRSVRRAYNAFLKENYPSRYEELQMTATGYTTWLRHAKEMKWKSRAEAWDEYRNNLLHMEILDASRFLMEHAIDAAKALVEALENPRLQVIAANSILDRTGLPSVSRQELLDVQVAVNADEMAKLKEAVKEWERSTTSTSG